MNILVTGGAGYIGSHFCKYASSQGHQVVTFDNLSTGHREFVKFGPLEEGDLSDSNRIQEVLNKYEIEAVVHFAAKAIIAESFVEKNLYWENNVEGTRSLLWAMSMAGVSKILFSSSCTTYGVSDAPYLSEEHPQNPINPYGETKKACEEMVIDFQEGLPGAKAGILRYFNVIGCEEDGSLWENHEPETHLIPNLLKAANKGEVVSIFGDQYNTRDGTCVRDYIDVRDLAEIHLAALDQIEEQNMFISNIGLGRGYSILEIKDIMEDLLEVSIESQIEEAREGDPPRLVADVQFFKSWYSRDLRSVREGIMSMKQSQKYT